MIRQTVNNTRPITHFFKVAGLNTQLFRFPRIRIEDPFEAAWPKSGVVLISTIFSLKRHFFNTIYIDYRIFIRIILTLMALECFTKIFIRLLYTLAYYYLNLSIVLHLLCFQMSKLHATYMYAIFSMWVGWCNITAPKYRTAWQIHHLSSDAPSKIKSTINKGLVDSIISTKLLITTVTSGGTFREW